jgi:hydrogenase maturation factor
MEVLGRLLSKVKIKDKRVILGPQTGEDAALINFGDKLLVAKTDPITFATDLIGWYAVQVNANDLAVMGATPKWFMATILLPEGSSENLIEAIFDQILKACEDLNVTLVGGHSEITYDLPRPIVVGAMMGEVKKGTQILTSGAKTGDSIVLTKGIAIEGTSLLARDATESLINLGVNIDFINQAKNLLFNPGISVLKEAYLASKNIAVHSMHDPTEGGLATGLLEISRSAKVGMFVEYDKIPILPECKFICDTMKLDPLGLLASGSLLFTTSQKDADKIIPLLRAEGITSSIIGQIKPPQNGTKILRNGQLENLPIFERDEFARFLSS